MSLDHPGLRVGPTPSSWGAHRNGWTHRTQRRESHEDEQRPGGHGRKLGLPGATGGGRRREGPSSEPLEGAWPWILAFSFQSHQGSGTPSWASLVSRGSGHLACSSGDQVPSEALGEPPSPPCHPGTTEPGVMARAWAWCQPRGSQADRAEQGPDHRQKCREPRIKEKMGFEKLMSLKPEDLP